MSDGVRQLKIGDKVLVYPNRKAVEGEVVALAYAKSGYINRAKVAHEGFLGRTETWIDADYVNFLEPKP
jgi:hypothetical protein